MSKLVAVPLGLREIKRERERVRWSDSGVGWRGREDVDLSVVY